MASPGDGNSPEPPARAGGGDPHGEAALLLVESLIHCLLVSGKLTFGMAIETVQTAIDVQSEVEIDRGDPSDVPSPTTLLLELVLATLRIDDLG